MFKNHLKIALRNIKKYKFYSLTTVAGLTFGMSCSILILLYVKDELSYEKHHEKADRIYRVIMQLEGRGQVESSVAHTSLTLAPKLGSTFPEIEKAVRLLQWRNVTLGYEDKMFNVERFFLADQSIFEVFTFQFLTGDPETALTEPYSAVVTASTAKRYFGDADPLGKLLTAGTKEVYKVTGVIADMPPQSHFHCDFIGSLATLGEISDPYRLWGHTYLLLPAGYSPAELEEKLVAITNQEALGWFFYGMKFRLQPITKIHLYSRHSGELEANGDIRDVYIFSAIALLILFIACVNYMNMATARFTHRAREVGIRKVFGSQRLHLIGQFLGESVLFSFGAVILSLMLVELLLPLFNSLIQKSITINYGREVSFLLGCAAIALLVGIASGSYPAFFLSAFHPARVLKGTLNSRLGAIGIRKTLVVAQFAVAIALILSTVVIQNQLGYVRNKKLGFEKGNIVVIPISEVSLRKQHETFKNELLQNPSIVNVSAASGTPFDGGAIAAFHGSRLHIKEVDHDYISTLQIELTQGRNFVATDTAAFILSETAVNVMEWDDPLGKTFATGMSNMRYNRGVVIGVIKDFHTNSLHRAIEPIALQFSPGMFTTFLVKIRAENIPATLDFLKQKWQAFVPNHPFEYSFLDEEFDKLYRSEQQLGKIFGYFSFLAILISCLGLFGLTAFAVERRTKEIGIRKALGASVANILFLLSKDFMKLVILANLMAWPVAYIAMQNWLQKFAYRIEIGSWMFLAAGGLVLLIALVAVSLQTIKAAVTNPVESLRYE